MKRPITRSCRVVVVADLAVWGQAVLQASLDRKGSAGLGAPGGHLGVLGELSLSSSSPGEPIDTCETPSLRALFSRGAIPLAGSNQSPFQGTQWGDMVLLIAL